jgi:hypothetical protein
MEDEMLTAKQLNPVFDSLYRGESELYLAPVAPYLFPVGPYVEFDKWFLENGWGKAWGIMAYSSKDLATLVKHFRKFLIVRTEGGNELYFRFYDPRIFRIFLPSCNHDQLMSLFEEVDYYVCEDEIPLTGTIFSIEHSSLRMDKISKEELSTFHQEPAKTSFFNSFHK